MFISHERFLCPTTPIPTTYLKKCILKELNEITIESRSMSSFFTFFFQYRHKERVHQT